MRTLFTGLTLFSSAVLCAPHMAFASDNTTFITLAPDIPYIGGKFNDMPTLLNTLLFASVAIAALLAVIMVAVGGFKWMTTDSVFAIGDAKSQITEAITGLLVVLMAVLVLKTINPELLNLNIFRAGEKDVSTTNTGGGTTLQPKPRD